MGTTANRSYPYPDPGNAADMAGGLEALAEAVDLDVQTLVNSVALPPMMVVTGGDATLNRINSGSQTNMVYTTVDYDNDNIANLADSQIFFSVTTMGTYLAHFSARVPDVTTRMEAFLLVSGLDYGRVLHQGNAPGQPRLVICALVPNLSPGQPITTTVTQNTGSIQTISGPRLVLYKVA